MFEKFKQNKSEKTTNTRERWKISFEDAVPTEFPSVYKLSDGRVYVSLHYGQTDGTFNTTDSEEEINVASYLSNIKQVLNAKEILLSCCFPDSAKEVVQNIPGVRLVGTGDTKTSTYYDEKYKRLTVQTADYDQTS